MAETEKVFFEQGNLKVTNARFVVPAQTYAMSGITSVKTVLDQPRKGPAILGVLGLIVMAPGEAASIMMGLLMVIGAIFWFIKRKKYIVVLSSASGETEALSSQNSDHINQIVNAINEAIINRG